jgi:FkbM family methyltransferase
MSDSVLAEPLSIGTFEDAERRALQRLAEPGMIAFDIGANVGIYSVLLGKAVGPAGQVWSIEPFPRSAAYLRRNLTLNGLTDTRAIEGAVSDVNGESEFHVFPDGSDVYNSLGATKRPVEGIQAVSRLRVPTFTLDAFCAQRAIPKVDLIKLDVEGAEDRVLAGAEGVLKNSPHPVILTEMYDPSLAQCGSSRSGMMSRMLEWGFGLFTIGRHGELVQVPHHSDFRATSAIFMKGA